MKHPAYDNYRKAYNQLTVNLIKAVNGGKISEKTMIDTLRLVNSGGDDFLIEQILQDGGQKIIKYRSIK